MRKPYPSDVSDEEWAFVAPYLTLMTQEAPQRYCQIKLVENYQPLFLYKNNCSSLK
ncbi:MAG: hypothetical protein CLLPBCKN_001536 [Chroococcidiopsis cubana SAG 39.79]|nr:hypothetical protein [Chroococcidiopsis cubana SAG 39.79]